MAFGIGEAPEQRTVNGFFCTGCNTLLVSLFTHDYKSCDCGNVVDGGSSYIRRGYEDFDSYKKVVEIFDWAGILIAAELGFTSYLNPLTQAAGSDLLQQLIDQERLIFAKDAKKPDGDRNDLIFLDDIPDDPTKEELLAAQVQREARDRDRASEILNKISDLSLGNEGG